MSAARVGRHTGRRIVDSGALAERLAQTSLERIASGSAERDELLLVVVGSIGLDGARLTKATPALRVACAAIQAALEGRRHATT